MQSELINQTYIEEHTEFKQHIIKRKWDILILVVEGEYSVTIPEKQCSFVLGKNDIMFLPAWVEMEREVLSPLTCYHLTFSPQADHPFYLAASTGKLHLPMEQITAIFQTLERAFVLPDNRELMTHLISQVFAANYLFGNNKAVNTKPFSDEIEHAIRYMRNNFSKKIDMDALAEQVFLSHSGLIWKFKQELNTTPSNYLRILRLRYAKQLLLNYSYSITEISEMCGYSNPYYFTNAFRGFFGMSSSDFRKHYLKKP
jgi:AraC-like DNA-binding protein